MTVELPDIAFVGKAGAGKSTAANFLVEHHLYRRLSFAAPLKTVASEIWGHAAQTDRNKLQKLGVAVRLIDPEAWVNRALRTLHQWNDDAAGSRLVRNMPAYISHPRVVVDDMRFPNEYWALKQEGFKIVRIEADRNRRVARLQANGKLQDEAQLEHESEMALDYFGADATIYNDAEPAGFTDTIARLAYGWAS